MSKDTMSLVNEIATQMKALHEMLEQRAEELQVSGADPERAVKMVQGAAAMRDSANIYLSWARHYIGIAEGGPGKDMDDEDDLDELELE